MDQQEEKANNTPDAINASDAGKQEPAGYEYSMIVNILAEMVVVYLASALEIDRKNQAQVK